MMDISKELIKIAGGADRLLNLEDNQFSIFGNGNKYGYKLKNSDLIIIPPIFDNAKDFSNGLAKVFIAGKYGFINKIGDFIVPHIYDYAYDFSDGLALVVLDGKSGFVNNKGKIVIPIQYEYIGSFSEGLSPVIDKGVCFYINKSAEISLILQKTYKHIYSFHEGLAKFCDCHGRYGFINKKGIEVIAPIYSDAHHFREGLVAVCNNGKWGYIDYLGNVRIPFRYERCTDFVNGKADVSEIKLVSRDQVSYSIDKQGRCCGSELVIDGSVKKTFKTIWDVLKSIYVLLRFLR